MYRNHNEDEEYLNLADFVHRSMLQMIDNGRIGPFVIVAPGPLGWDEIEGVRVIIDGRVAYDALYVMTEDDYKEYMPLHELEGFDGFMEQFLYHAGLDVAEGMYWLTGEQEEAAAWN